MKDPLCDEDDNSQRGKRLRYSGSNLPEDMWYIHSLMPLRDAAVAAGVSHTFLCSWRCYPNLLFSNKTLGLKRNAGRKGDIARAFTNKVDHILKNHSRIGVKTLELNIFDYPNLNACILNNWLQIAITPGIHKITLTLSPKHKEGYNFPCSLLFGESGSSLRRLHLLWCAFRPTVGLRLRSLTKLCLLQVHITGDELVCLLSNSFALKKLVLSYCKEITCLKVPLLEQLNCLIVSACGTLKMVESKAPNLSRFNYSGGLIQLSVGQSFQMKNLCMSCFSESNLLCYAITKLPYIAPNLESLDLRSGGEKVNTPMVAPKFIHLKYLKILLDGDVVSPEYDYLSLVSFLDASPVLETFILSVQQDDMKHESVFANASHLRQMPEHKHNRLKNVMILGFCSAKSMVELTCHILENATSLECITVDTVCDADDEDNIGRCSVTSAREAGECSPISNEMILETDKALMAIERYIAGKVPSTVKLNVRGGL